MDVVKVVPPPIGPSSELTHPGRQYELTLLVSTVLVVVIIMACHIVYDTPYCNDAKEGVGGITPPKLNRGG